MEIAANLCRRAHGLPRRFASLVLACLAVAAASAVGPALAEGFSPEQRQQIVAIVRQALRTDPTILGDAIVALRASEENTEASDAAAAIRTHQAALSGTKGDFIAGNPNGTVTMVVFYDPRCPYCRKMLPVLDRLVAEEPRLRLIEKLIPILGPGSMMQARAIEAAARQGRYAALQHALMTDNAIPTEAQWRHQAASLGIDVARLQRDIRDPTIDAQLQSDTALAQSLGITGTPSFVIGDQLIPGAVAFDALRQLVANAAPAVLQPGRPERDQAATTPPSGSSR